MVVAGAVRRPKTDSAKDRNRVLKVFINRSVTTDGFGVSLLSCRDETCKHRGCQTLQEFDGFWETKKQHDFGQRNDRQGNGEMNQLRVDWLKTVPTSRV